MLKKVIATWLTILVSFSISNIYIQDEEISLYTFNCLIIPALIICLFGGFWLFKPQKNIIKNWKFIAILNGIFLSFSFFTFQLILSYPDLPWVSIILIFPLIFFTIIICYRGVKKKYGIETNLYYRKILKINIIFIFCTISILAIPGIYKAKYLYGVNSTIYKDFLIKDYLALAHKSLANEKYIQANVYAKQAHEIAVDNNFSAVLLQKSLNYLAWIAHENNQHEKALTHIDELLDFYKWKTPEQVLIEISNKYQEEYFSAIRRKGLIYSDYGDYQLSDSLLLLSKEYFNTPFLISDINQHLARNSASTGQMHRADSLYSEVIAYHENSGNYDFWNNLYAIEAILNVKYNNTDTIDARLLLKKSYDIVREKHGDISFKTNYLKVLQAKQATLSGNLKQAEKIMLQTLPIIVALYGENTYAYEEARLHLVANYLSQSKLKEAKKLLDELEPIIQNKYPRNLNLNEMLQHTLGQYYNLNIEYDLAAKHFNNCLNSCIEHYGEQSIYNISILDGLADVYYRDEKMNDFEKTISKSFNIKQQASYINIASMGVSMGHCGLHYLAIDSIDQAGELLQNAQFVFKKSLGEKHPRYATAKNNFGLYFQKKKDYKKAIKIFRESLDLNHKIFNGTSISEAITQINLAETLLDNKQPKLALTEYKKAWSIYANILEADHPYLEYLSKKVKDLEESIRNMN